MRFGRKCPRGFLPIFSVDTEEEANALLVAACPRNGAGEFIAPELAQQQTLPRLYAFGARLRGIYRRKREMRAAKVEPVAPAPKASPARVRFDALRARYLAAQGKFLEHESAMRWKYGERFQSSWASAGERKKLDSTRAAADKAGTAFSKHLDSISPRDWSYGVPVHWLREHLTYEDAVRPAGEKLSVVPPLSYGAMVHRT